LNIAALTATVALGVLAGVAGKASAQGVTAYEGARIIVGDGRVLDNATIVVSARRSRRSAAPYLPAQRASTSPARP
jgi:hypothetical protein